MARAGRRRRDRVAVYLALVMLAIAAFFSLATTTFFTLRNFLNLVESYSVTGIFTMGLLVVLVAGGIDISFLATASVAQYLAVVVSRSLGLDDSFILGVLPALAAGAFIGLVNGALIHYLAVVSIIVTISTQSVMFGGLMYSSGGRSIYNLPGWMYQFSGTLFSVTVGGQRHPIGAAPLVMAVAAVLTFALLAHTTTGRQLYAMGGNPEAARRLGIRLGALHLFAYGYLGLMAAIGGITQALRVEEVVPNALVGREFDVLAAAILGGASFAGGRGGVAGAILGVFLIGLLKNGLNLFGVSSYFSDVIIGPVIVIALCATHLGKRKETDVGFA
ncbi:MAG: ABC transporter permease [Planctomycetota bacterium]|jgi:simple sugar transport system permease protein|nr:ABC transporter permease [Planctomycetota bacterium]